MSMNGPVEMTAQAGPARPQGGLLGFLRTVALVATVAGAAGSVALLLRAGPRQKSLLLIVLFTIWVLSPFVVLFWANLVSKRWSVVTRATLYCVTLVLTLGSVAIYGEVVVLKPPGSPNVFLFVAVPPAS